MRPDTVLSYVKAQPFRPFRLVMNSGRSLDVRHPEMLKVGRDVVNYYYGDSPDAPFDRWDTFSLLLVEHIEHLAVPTQPPENVN